MIVRKLYWNYEKEEQWLNEMAIKGMSLKDYSWGRYVFEETPMNLYKYRIELLENVPTHPESVAYLRFLEDNGVEYVASYMRWVYLRKKVAEGPFDIYTDIDSRIKHYKRINNLWTVLMLVEISVGISTISTQLITLNSGSGSYSFSYINLVLGIVLILLGLLFWRLGLPIRDKIKELKQEKIIRE